MMLVVLMLPLAGPGPQTIDQPRKQSAACVKRFETSSLKARMDVAAYTAAVKTACPDEAAALTKALVAYDVGMGTKRSEAASNAAIDVNDYVESSLERYQATVDASKPK